MTDLPITESDLLSDARDTFRDRVRDTLRVLLEEKHLYQSIQIDTSDIPDTDLLARLRGSPLPSLSAPAVPRGATQDEQQQAVQSRVQAVLFNATWSIENPRTRIRRPPMPGGSGGGGEPPRVLDIDGPDAKLYCRHCRRRGAFNLVAVAEAPSGPRGSREASRLNGRVVDIPGKTVQVFVLEYECQSCTRGPEVFLVRREGLKITLSGRAPIEVIEVRRYVPEAVRSYFGSSVLAYNSGQTLAANFLLRTTVEQWARLSTGSEDRDAAKVIERYAESLPDDFKSRFPSFRELYSDLSEDLHAAVGDADLFERARRDIEKHFDARRLYELNSAHVAVGEDDEQ